MTFAKNQRILIIDDNPAIHEDFRKILGNTFSAEQEIESLEASLFGENQRKLDLPNFEIDSAYQGEEGLECIRKSLDKNNPYAMAFVDIRMPPGWDGIETIQRIWKEYPDLQVVICTAYSDYSWPEMIERLGQTDRLLILKKPFDNVEVRQLACSMIEKWNLSQQVKDHVKTLKGLVTERSSQLHVTNWRLFQEMDEHNKAKIILDKLSRQNEQILNSAAEGIYGVDIEGRISFINPAAAELIGHDIEAVLGKFCQEIFQPAKHTNDSIPWERSKICDTLKTGHIHRVENQTFSRKSGARFPVEYVVSPLLENGKICGAVVVFSDVTARKKAKEEVEMSLSLLRATLESTADGILVVNQERRVVNYNQRFCDMWGIPKNLIDSASDTQILQVLGSKVKDSQLFFRKINEIYANPESESFDLLEFSDGKIFERFSRPQRVEGISVGRVWSFRDLTERKNLESQLRQSQKIESIGQLAAGIAHDFNNILTVIQGCTNLLLVNDDLSPEMRDSLEQIAESAMRATTLTRQLLAFSRRQVMQLKSMDLTHIIHSMNKMLSRVLGEDISLEVQCAPNLPLIRADIGMVEQIIINLAVNSRDAMPAGGKLWISTFITEIDPGYVKQHPDALVGRFVCLTVTDTGCGMDSATLLRIFEPFFTTKDVGKGTGLGLATVYGIVKQHQGWIEVESAVGKGTTFKIYFPVSDKDHSGSMETRKPSSKASANNGKVVGGTETILLVEDETRVRTLSQTILEKYGYKVLVAESGKEALKMWDDHADQVDLLLTDLVMPDGISGRELAKRLQALKPSIKILYTSGYSSDFAGGDFGLQDHELFLQKPFEPHMLGKMVRKALDCK